ncbi:hypothetical protein J8J14_24490 [Roseomonas sp. SSH11]|uniref:Uncharacterized protein n=1 Tax=Pararoseomonas baculiformis TaxID=2820812 RepID=A0ABS4AMZ9_9PROT|nr:hypothetical protein [Pararoseomonas baculiformis]MBP0447893.1 hypothetical protein [Pararoseomonas baculiformis]
MPTITDIPSRSRHLLAGFAHIPLYAEDLAPFGGALRTNGHTIWAEHRDAGGALTGQEIIHGGPKISFSFTRGGKRALFQTAGRMRPRLLLTDGPPQAICAAALEHPDLTRRTTYAAPGGGWTPAASEALAWQLDDIEEVVLGFALAPDGSCRSRTAVEEVLELLPHGSRLAVTAMPPGPGGWVAALQAARRSSLAA